MKKVLVAILSVVLMGSAAFAATTTIALYRCGEGYSPPAIVGSDAQPLMDSTSNALHYATYMGSTWGGGPVTYSTDLPSLLAGYSTRSYQIVHNGFWDGPGSTYDWPDDNIGVEGWIKTDPASGGQTWGTKMFGLGGPSQFFTYRVNGQFYATVNGVDFGHTAVPGPELEWVHLALVRLRGTSTFYFNGNTAGTSTGDPGGLAGGSQFEKDSGWTVWTGYADEIPMFSFDPNLFDPILDIQYNSSALSAWNPTPVQGATGIPSTQVLSWKTGRDPNNLSQVSPLITGHGVYIGTDRAAVEAATPADVTGIFKGYQSVGQTTCTPTLENNKTYYWRIDERLNSDTRYVKGWTWSFGTVVDFPVITGQPQDAYVKVGNTATFTVDAYDSQGNPLGYKWYKVGTPDEQLSDTSKYSGTATAQLKVLNVAVADEASFYCVVSNSFGPTQSNSAALVAARLLGHWPFNGDAQDVVGTNHGMVIGSPDFMVAGIVDSNSVRTSAGNYLYVPWTPMTHLSISFWAFPEGNAGNDYIIGCGDPSGAENFFVRIVASSPDAYDVAFNGGVVRFDYLDYPRAWHYIVVSYASGTANWYVDGVLVGTISPLTLNQPIDNRIYIGDRRNGTRRFTGRIDDFKLYNYPLSAFDVADAYANVTGQEFCFQTPAGDINGDCLVNLADLTMLISNWMQCGKVPDCL